jgi:hypothetical protein
MFDNVEQTSQLGQTATQAAEARDRAAPDPYALPLLDVSYHRDHIPGGRVRLSEEVMRSEASWRRLEEVMRSEASWRRLSVTTPHYDDLGRSPLDPIPKIDHIHSRVYKAAMDMHRRGQFNMRNWCTCRAGIVVSLAGTAGYNLARKWGHIGVAAQMIYQASGYNIALSHFIESDYEALVDMQRLAIDERANAPTPQPQPKSAPFRFPKVFRDLVDYVYA